MLHMMPVIASLPRIIRCKTALVGTEFEASIPTPDGLDAR